MSRQITGVPVEPTELASAAQLTTTNVEAYREYQAGDYERSFTLSDEVDPEGIKATLKNGVLRLELHKKDEVKPRKIPVTTD